MWYPPKTRTDQLDNELAKLVEDGLQATEDREGFLLRVSACIRFLAGHANVPRSTLRDWIWIGSQFRIRSELSDRASRLAAGYLRQLEQLLNGPKDRPSPLVQDLRWITDSGVTSLLSELGQRSWNKFLSADERQAVEDSLHAKQAICSALSAEEKSALEEYISLLRGVASETYHPGIADMISYLAKYAESSDLETATARACLRYVLEPNDVVPDALGYLGLVDDIYAVEQALREIEHRETWDPLTDHFRENWPFLDRVVFQEPERSTRLPTYLQLLAGAALHDARDGGARTCIVMPEVGFCGILVAFLSAIEAIRSANSLEHEVRPRFEKGDCILFGDGARAIKARYAGILEYAGQSLQSIELARGGKQTIDQDVLSLARQAAAPHKRLSTSQEYAEWKATYSTSPIAHLIGQTYRGGTISPKVLFLTRRNRLDHFLESLKPMQQSIPDLIGLTYISSTGNEESYAGNSASQSAIWACSDALTARDVLFEKSASGHFRYLICDDADLAVELDENIPAGKNINGTSIVALCGLHEREPVRRLLGKTDRSWLLREADSSLLAHEMPQSANLGSGEITRYRVRQELQSISTSQVHAIQCEPVQLLYLHLDELRDRAKREQYGSLEILAFSISRFIRRFLRSPTDFDEFDRSELNGLLQNITGVASQLSDFDEGVREFSEDVQQLFGSGIPDNPRTHKLVELVASYTNDTCTAIVCSSAPVATECAKKTAEHPVLARAKWVSLGQLREIAPVNRVIVPGWLDRRSMREIRGSGYGEHFELIMFDFEEEWEKRSRNAGLVWERHLVNCTARRFRDIEGEFPKLRPPSAIISPTEPVDEQELLGNEDEEHDDFLDARMIERIRSQANKGGGSGLLGKARLLTFEDAGTYFYIPPNGSVISLSRAFESLSSGPDAGKGAPKNAERLVSAMASDLNKGDLLAFPVDRTADLLGELAARFLREPQATKRKADLWRQALRSYRDRTSMTATELQRKLEQAGLKRHPVTIAMWLQGSHIVAPQNYDEAIAVIADVTGDDALQKQREEVSQAVDLIYRARAQAASEILKHISSQEISLKEGTAIVRIEGREIRFQLHRLLSVGPPEDVPQEEIGVLKNISDLLVPSIPEEEIGR